MIRYICEPEKNTKCSKTFCQEFCKATAFEEYAKRDEHGAPIVAKDLELVIKIPRVIYESCKQECEENDALIIDNYTYAIGTGTPLPKEHGRLGDLGKIYVELNEAQIEGTEEYKGLGKAKQIVCDAKTIIEPYKAESEEDE